VSTLERQAHWQNVYQTKGERDVSWFQESPAISLELIRTTGVRTDASVIDIGGGASRLVDALIAEGFRSVTVLDLSEKALATSRERLGSRAGRVNWIVADVTGWKTEQIYDVWHDRAAFHFLTDHSARTAYAQCVLKAVRPGGHVIMGTFAPDGPERCSGLPVIRYDAASLGVILGPLFRLEGTVRDDHQTPTGSTQRFQFSSFVRGNS
jgi:2-polyprenyl-3-methyl-5-hydroxy-6-metoxy-1,4-benzoquinol methylase